MAAILDRPAFQEVRSSSPVGVGGFGEHPTVSYAGSWRDWRALGTSAGVPAGTGINARVRDQREINVLGALGRSIGQGAVLAFGL